MMDDESQTHRHLDRLMGRCPRVSPWCPVFRGTRTIPWVASLVNGSHQRELTESNSASPLMPSPTTDAKGRLCWLASRPWWTLVVARCDDGDAVTDGRVAAGQRRLVESRTRSGYDRLPSKEECRCGLQWEPIMAATF